MTTRTGLQRDINASLYEKQRNLDIIQKQTRLIQRLQDINERKVAISDNEAPTILYELDQCNDDREKIRSTLAKLRNEHPHLAEVLDRVNALTDI